MTKNEEYQKFFTRSCNKAQINNAKGILSDLLNTDESNFDKYPYLLNMPGGTLDLQTDRSYPADRNNYLTQITACNAAADYHGSLWDQTLMDVIPDAMTREYLQRYCGYCLSGDVSEELFLIAYGEGGKGKGTVFETMAAAMGDYATQIPVEVILKHKYAANANAPTPELIKLKGKRLALCTETGLGRKLDEAKIKWLTGGDTITARAMYAKKPISFTPTHKIIIQSNYLPQISDANDTGLDRRYEIIPFHADITDRDTTLKQRLRTPEELQHVMAWLLEGFKKWQSGSLSEPSEEMKAMKRKYKSDNDLLSQWCVECCNIGSDLEMPMKQGKEAYNEWLTGGRTEKVGLQEFSADMESHGYVKRRKNTGYVFKGIELKGTSVENPFL